MGMTDLLYRRTLLAKLIDRVLARYEERDLCHLKYALKSVLQVAKQVSDRQRLHELGDTIEMLHEVIDVRPACLSCET